MFPVFLVGILVIIWLAGKVAYKRNGNSEKPRMKYASYYLLYFVALLVVHLTVITALALLLHPDKY